MRDFNGLADWFRIKWTYENTPPLQRPNSLAWDICKTTLTTATPRSGKSTPCVGSGRSSPSVSGKLSPKPLNPKKLSNSCPTSPLPIFEGKEINLNAEQSPKKEEEPSQEKTNQKSTQETEQMKIKSELNNKEKQTEVKTSRKVAPKADPVKKRLDAQKAIDGKTKVVPKVKETKTAITKKDNKSISPKTTPRLTKTGCKSNEDLKTNSKEKTNNNELAAEVTKSEKSKLDLILQEPSEFSKQITTVKNIDSPSEDQRTYDTLRKVGVQSAEKSTSTDDDYPRLPPVKKPNAVKVHQECQTDDTEKKVQSIAKTAKIEANKCAKPLAAVRPAYSTALGRTVTVTKAAIPRPKSETKTAVVPSKTVKPFTATRAAVTAKNETTRSRAMGRTGLARSKTLGDMKSSGISNNMKGKSAQPKPQSTTQLPVSVRKQDVPKPPMLQKSYSTLSKKDINKISSSNECASSVETLVNQGHSSENINISNNSLASSTETINNDNNKGDGWLTVKSRSRFKHSNGKPRRSDTALSWATRFHQVSTTASLPALALLPENGEVSKPAKSIDKSVKENLNTLKSFDTAKIEKKVSKQSHSAPSRGVVNKKSNQDKNNVNQNKKKSSDNKENVNKKLSDGESETDDETKFKEEDLDTEEEHRQLSEEEDRLTREIEDLQRLEIEVDTETDGTETDGELQGDVEDAEEADNENNPEDSDMSLEARYEPILAGNILKCLNK